MTDKEFMSLALEEALRAYHENEVPIGAVLIDEDGILISREHNRIEQLNDATAHAEILALRAASQKLNRRRLSDCTLYSTVEPCAMCAGALVLCRVKRIVYGVTDSKFGAAESIFNVVNNPALNHQLEVTAGVLEEDCRKLMKRFFDERRLERNCRL
ncbi:MAG: tRNA adenosine(34) deaminase TadA [Selenomonadaceae bacterium]|nr:tRNA adenosine(34) deaminase TadA [Selenomonadaceae bacterium]